MNMSRKKPVSIPSKNKAMNNLRKSWLLGGAVGIALLYIVSGTASAHEWMAPKKAAMVMNPVLFNAESVDQGRETFLNNCAVCHGDVAEGMSADEAGLTKDVPNLKKRLATHSDGDFFWKIQQGKGEMPSFRGELKEEEIWHIINFLKCCDTE